MSTFGEALKEQDAVTAMLGRELARLRRAAKTAHDISTEPAVRELLSRGGAMSQRSAEGDSMSQKYANLSKRCEPLKPTQLVGGLEGLVRVAKAAAGVRRWDHAEQDPLWLEAERFRTTFTPVMVLGLLSDLRETRQALSATICFGCGVRFGDNDVNARGCVTCRRPRELLRMYDGTG